MVHPGIKGDVRLSQKVTNNSSVGDAFRCSLLFGGDYTAKDVMKSHLDDIFKQWNPATRDSISKPKPSGYKALFYYITYGNEKPIVGEIQVMHVGHKLVSQ